jgi:hypothetical protein
MNDFQIVVLFHCLFDYESKYTESQSDVGDSPIFFLVIMRALITAVTFWMLQPVAMGPLRKPKIFFTVFGARKISRANNGK